jgi:hypothetical protein
MILVVQTHEVTKDKIDMPFMPRALECSALECSVGQMRKTVSISINNHYRLRI